MRIGHGYDVHRLVVGRPLIIGGTRIEYERGLEAHSDGDVLVHAVCDALLGAAGKGDIGRWFPDSADEFANIDSRILLRRVVSKLHEEAFRVHNVDVTLVAQAPKMAPHIDRMRSRLAEDLQIPPSRLNIKATTTEGMGFAGRGDGIACYAVALIEEP